MSIANLFVENSYTIKCSGLECRELTAGDVIVPTGIIDDLYTDRIRSGQTQNVVANISSGSAEFYGNVFPNTNETLDLGTDTNKWNNLRCKNVDASGTTETQNLIVNGIFASPSAQISGTCVANNFTSLGSNNFSAETTCNDLVVTNQGTFTNLLRVNNLLFLSPGGQTSLSKYEYVNVPNGLQVYGAIDISHGITASYSGTRVGNFVSLSIEAFQPEAVFSTILPIIVGIIDPGFVPAPGVTISTIISVQTNIGAIVPGLALIKDNGTLEIYAGLTDTSYFTSTHVIGSGYPLGTYFSINYTL